MFPVYTGINRVSDMIDSAIFFPRHKKTELGRFAQLIIEIRFN